MAAVMKSVDILKSEIEKTRQNLHQTDLTIRKITGRDEHNNNRYPRQEGPTPTKRRLSGTTPAFRNRHASNRDSGGDDDDDDKVKLSLPSAVIATNKDSKSREEVIQQQSQDKEGTARNRRMFSLLMGTLNQFKVDEKKNEKQGRKRKEVEKKLEVKQKEETDKMKKEKQQLFHSKRQQQLKLRQLEVKMEVVQLHDEWEEQSRQLMHYIRTDSKPHIYYLPKIHNSTTLKKLEQSKKLIEAVVAKRRGMLDEEINSILKAEEENFHAEDDGEHKDDDEPPRKMAKLDKEGKVRTPGGKSKLIHHNRQRSSQDQDESDLEFNERHESVGVDYQTSDAVEQEKNDSLNNQHERGPTSKEESTSKKNEQDSINENGSAEHVDGQDRLNIHNAAHSADVNETVMDHESHAREPNDIDKID